MKLRWLSVLAVAGACRSPGLMPLEPSNIVIPPADPPMPLLVDLLVVPHDSPELPAEIEGLIYSEGPSPWGLAFSTWDAQQGLMPREPVFGDPREPPDPDPTYMMSVLDSPYSVYFRSAGEGIMYQRSLYVGLPGGENTSYDAAFYSPTTPNELGLREPAHLVAMEVNDRRGGARGSFVATKVRVLDREYGIAPTQLLTKLRARFDAAVAKRDEAMRYALDDGKGKLRYRTIETQPLTKSVAIWPTWNTHDRTMRVVFVLEWLRGRTSECRRATGDPTLFALKVRCTPGGTLQSYGAAMAAVYRIDVTGKVLEEKVFAPISYEGDLGQYEQSQKWKRQQEQEQLKEQEP